MSENASVDSELTQYDCVSMCGKVGVASIVGKVMEARFRQYRLVRSQVAALRFDPGRHRSSGRPVKQWINNIREDMRSMGPSPKDASVKDVAEQQTLVDGSDAREERFYHVL